jgi:NADH:ubiquinone oxidoreductase subunit E/NAD-dependent dihydropyrimidine dehydrogenase PreA subunit
VRTDRIPGLAILKGMAFAVRQVFRPNLTVRYPEQLNDISPRHRGRLILVYDEAGTLKCETCFQCAQACPVECIDMGGVDTRDRYHVHWGAPEQYAERREESALRRSGRPVPDRAFEAFERVDLAPVDEILSAGAYKPANALPMLEQVQGVYGHLPVAALQHIAHQTGADYAGLYGLATSYPHLHFEPPVGHIVRVCRCTGCTLLGGGRVLAAFREHLGTDVGGVSPDGAVRLGTTECGGASTDTPYVEVDGEPLPKSSPEDAATIAAALRASVPQGEAA